MEIFSVQKGGPPKIGSPVWLNMPKAGPDSVQQSSSDYSSTPRPGGETKETGGD